MHVVLGVIRRVHNQDELAYFLSHSQIVPVGSAKFEDLRRHSVVLGDDGAHKSQLEELVNLKQVVV